MQIRIRAAGAALLVLTVVGTGCSSSGGGDAASPTTATTAATTTTADPTTTTAVATDGTATRDDVGCDAEALGTTDELQFFDARYVVDGQPGAWCFGKPDPTMDEAWTVLAAITPPERLADLALFAGFTSPASDEPTLAFVNAIDDGGTVFQMSVNLDEYDADPQEAELTMAHEFSHVFTGTPDQVDRSVASADGCDTYYNGEGCYLPDSLMADWISQFWTAEELAGVDPNADTSVEGGQQRCNLDPGFLGPYAASAPEEDFAETFSAFVFEVPAPTDEVQAKYDWMADHPELVEFRQRADDAQLTPLKGSFDTCGG